MSDSAAPDDPDARVAGGRADGLEVIPFLQKSRRSEKAPSRVRLTEEEARILLALGETVFPPSDDLPVTVDEAGIVEYMEELLAAVPAREQVMVRGMLWLFEVQSFVTRPSALSRFSRASLEDRAASLATWETSENYFRRLIFQALRGLLLWAYVDNPSVGQAMGVEPGSEIIRRQRRERVRTEPGPTASAAKEA